MTSTLQQGLWANAVGQLWKKGNKQTSGPAATRKERISGLTLKETLSLKQWKFLCGALW